MTILITGAGGFIGQELTLALLKSTTSPLLITDIAAPPIPPGYSADRVISKAADLTSPSSFSSLLSHLPMSASGAGSLEVCYLMHGIMSSGAEANLDLGLKVNLDSFRVVLDVLRREHEGVKVVFPSSLAVYGPEGESIVATETLMPRPENSYGSQKLMVETLLNDFSRRGLLDARICRLPTIIVRPGAPTAAASSFASGIVREPLNGQPSVLPVSPSLKMWLCSPKTVVANLMHARTVPAEKFVKYGTRVVNLPGITASVGEILEALEEVAGKEVRALVKEERDEVIERIVGRWPAYFDTSRAKELGFVDDVSLVETVKDYANSLKE